MNRFCIKCPTCGHPIESVLYNRGDAPIPCDVCKTKLTLHAMPALYRQAGLSGEALAAKLNDAVCFYHEGKTAEQVCDDCGRFLCGLCMLPIEQETLCASCLENRRTSDGMHAMTPRQMRYDKLAILLAAVSCFLVFFWFIPFVPIGIAMGALYVSIRHWKRKPPLAVGFRARMVVAAGLSVLSSVATILFAVFMFRTMINA